MHWEEFFQKKGISPSKFAIKNKIGITTIYRYMRGDSCPGLEKAKLLEKATKGKVTVAEMRSYNGKRTAS